MKTVARWIQVAAPGGMLGKVGGRVYVPITEATSTALGTLLSSNRVTDLQYSVSASGIPNNFFALHKYPGSRVASRHRVETENVSHERLYPNTCSKKSDVPVHFLVRKYSCAVFNSISFVMWSSRTIRSVLSPTTVTHLKYSAAAKRAVSMIKQSALSLALTCSIPGISASFNAI